MMIAQELGTKTYIVHTTTKDGPSIINSFKEKGLPVWCETCTHYLWLTDSTFEPKFPTGIYFMCSPTFKKTA
jgi:dihydropyrimidinase